MRSPLIPGFKPNPESKQLPFKYGLSIVIPCLNEEKTLGQSIWEAKNFLSTFQIPGEVIVSDNGSTDASREIALNSGARIVLVKQRGYGAALNSGIRKSNYSIVAFADADLSYPFSNLKALIDPLQNETAQCVLGSRFVGSIEPGSMPILNRYLGTPLLSFLIRFFYKLPVTDSNSGMRALKREVYDSLNLKSSGMEFASEMLIRIAQERLIYKEVPITFVKDQRQRLPHLKRWQDGLRHIRQIFTFAPERTAIQLPLFLGVVLNLSSLIISVISSRQALFSYLALVAMILGGLFFSISATVAYLNQFSTRRDMRGQRSHSSFENLFKKDVFKTAAFLLMTAASVECVLLFLNWTPTAGQKILTLNAFVRMCAYLVPYVWIRILTFFYDEQEQVIQKTDLTPSAEKPILKFSDSI